MIMEERLDVFKGVVLYDVKPGSEKWDFACESFRAGWSAAVTSMSVSDVTIRKQIIQENLAYVEIRKRRDD
jgi:hypothetical protein